MTQEGLELRLSILKVTRGCAVLTNSSPLAQKAKESLKSSSVKVKLNNRFFYFKRSAFFCPFEPIKPGYLVASSTASWKFFISPCDLCVYRSIPALKFLLKAVSNFSNLRLKNMFNIIRSLTERSVKTWTVRCESVTVSRGQSVTWPVLKTVENEIGWKVHLIH